MKTPIRYCILTVAAVLCARAFARSTDATPPERAVDTADSITVPSSSDAETPEPVLASFRAPPAETAKETDSGKETFTSDWRGYRTKLEDRGVYIHFGVWADTFQNTRGGANTADMDFMHIESLNFTLDTEKLFGFKGGTFFIDLQHAGGDNPSENVGDFQGVSNIGADRRDQLAEFWYEQKLLDGQVRFKVGKIDAAYEFDAIDAAGNFLNSSTGLSPTVVGFPTYPDPAFGIVAEYAPGESFYLRGGVFDGSGQEGKTLGDDGIGFDTFFGHPADLFLIGEAGFAWKAGHLPGRAALGIAYHTGTFDRFDGGTEDGVASYYCVFEQMIARESDDEDDAQGTSVFLRAGYTDGDTSDARYHLGGGIVSTGFCPGRNDDSAGVALNFIGFSNAPGADFGGDELNIELFYRAQITPYFSITPDVQYVVNPSGDDSLDDALAVGVRFVLEF